MCRRCGRLSSGRWLSNFTPQTQRIIELSTSDGSFSPRSRVAAISALQARSRRYSAKAPSGIFGSSLCQASSKAARARSNVGDDPYWCWPGFRPGEKPQRQPHDPCDCDQGHPEDRAPATSIEILHARSLGLLLEGPPPVFIAVLVHLNPASWFAPNRRRQGAGRTRPEGSAPRAMGPLAHSRALSVSTAADEAKHYFTVAAIRGCLNRKITFRSNCKSASPRRANHQSLGKPTFSSRGDAADDLRAFARSQNMDFQNMD